MATMLNVIQAAIDFAVTGTDPNTSVIQLLRQEAESCLDSALQELAEECAKDDSLRPRITKTFSVTLLNGVGTVPAGLLLQYLDLGLVQDGDSSAINGVGNTLTRVFHERDFYGPLPTVFGYYWVRGNAATYDILTRNLNTPYDFTGTVGPLAITAPRVPLKSEIPELDIEVTDRLSELLGIRLRGFLRPGNEGRAA